MTYGYLRVSTDKQDENNQKLGVDKKAESMGVKIDEYIIDAGVSGMKEPDKRALGKLMERLKPNDMIIASELSRLGRSMYMVMRILEFCMKNEVKVITVKDNYELGDNIQSKVLAFAFSLAAEIERDMISRRTKEALAKRRAEGVILGRPNGSKSSHVKLTGRENEIAELLKKNISMSAIGRIVGANRMTVMQFCKDNDLMQYLSDRSKKNSLHTKTYIMPKIERLCGRDDLIEHIQDGLTYSEIGMKYDINHTSVRTYVQNDNELFEMYKNYHQAKRMKNTGGQTNGKHA